MPEILHTLRPSVLLGALLVLVPLGALGQSDRPSIPSVRVIGEATVTAQPDQAQIDIGVITQAESAQTAAAQNAQKLNAVLAALRQALGAEAEIDTAGYSLRPSYHAPREGGQPAIAGYTASNVVQVRTGKLDEVGSSIDAATRAGANQVQRLLFTLQDVTTVRAQALRLAATGARTKAEALAEALALQLGQVLTVEEDTRDVRPVYGRAEGFVETRAAAAPTPLEPGTIDVHATVTLTIAVAP